MGIRESLLNTITSVGSSDFVRIVTSAGASSKATVQNLFKSFESGMGAKSSLTTSDYIRVVGSDDVAYKQSVSDVASVLSNALPLTGEVVTSLKAWAETINGKGITSTNTTTTDTPSGAPRKYGVAWTENYNHGSTIWLNLFWSPTQSDEIYYCHKTNTTAWSDWQKLPTRAEVAALNSKPIMASRILGGAYGGISVILVQDATAPYLRIDTPDGAYGYVRLVKY